MTFPFVILYSIVNTCIRCSTNVSSNLIESKRMADTHRVSTFYKHQKLCNLLLKCQFLYLKLFQYTI